MTMQHLGSHIASLLKLMNERSYDGHFLCNSSHPGKLKDSLTQHLLGALQGSASVPLFFLTTYSLWQDEQSPNIQCDFKVRYSHTEGFRVEKMEITNGNSYGKIKSVTLPFAANTEIPSRQQANRKVLDSERKIKIR
jgi:hypothetical protein